MDGCRTHISTLVLIATSCILSTGCGAASSTAPGPVGQAGEWRGTTFQGRPISFSVSSQQQVTAVSLGYQIDTCSGVETFSGLTVPLTSVGGVPAFQFAAKLADTRQIVIQGFLMPDGSIRGTVTVYAPPSCGRSETVAGMFTANRR